MNSLQGIYILDLSYKIRAFTLLFFYFFAPAQPLLYPRDPFPAGRWHKTLGRKLCQFLMSAPSLRHLGLRSQSIPSPQRFVTFSNFSHDRVFAAEKDFTFFFQNPLLPFGRSQFWHCLLFLENSKFNFPMCMYRSTACAQLDGSLPCVFIIWTILDLPFLFSQDAVKIYNGIVSLAASKWKIYA